jgi:asparagine synthetase B (glutamine-hydrolysing)
LQVGSGLSDTTVISNLLQTTEDVPRVIESIRGPGAFVYWQNSAKRLWFGRDWCGRRSLLLSLVTQNGQRHLVLSSVCPTAQTLAKNDLGLELCVELPARAVYSVDLGEISQCPVNVRFYSHDNLLKDEHSSLVTWVHCPSNLWQGFNPLNRSIQHVQHDESNLEDPVKILTSLFGEELEAAARELNNLLFKAVQRRTSTTVDYCSNCLPTREICKHCKTAVLFSGGLDSTVLAALCHKAVPVDEPIDLYNVAFVKSRGEVISAPDRVTGLQGFLELSAAFPEREWNFVQAS